ncbi:MAG: hypothetical protein RLZZ458_3066 [Planctomycetota bacterium]
MCAVMKNLSALILALLLFSGPSLAAIEQLPLLPDGVVAEIQGRENTRWFSSATAFFETFTSRLGLQTPNITRIGKGRVGLELRTSLNRLRARPDRGPGWFYFRGCFVIAENEGWLTSTADSIDGGYLLSELAEVLTKDAQNRPAFTVVLDLITSAEKEDVEACIRQFGQALQNSKLPFHLLVATESAAAADLSVQSPLSASLQQVACGMDLAGGTRSRIDPRSLTTAGVRFEDIEKYLRLQNIAAGGEKLRVICQSFPAAADSAVVAPTRANTLQELVDKVAATYATELQRNQLTKVVIVDPVPADGSASGRWEMLRRWLSEKLAETLQMKAGGRLALAPANLVRDILVQNNLRVDGLVGQLSEGVLQDFRNLLGAGQNERIAVLLCVLTPPAGMTEDGPLPSSVVSVQFRAVVGQMRGLTEQAIVDVETLKTFEGRSGTLPAPPQGTTDFVPQLPPKDGDLPAPPAGFNPEWLKRNEDSAKQPIPNRRHPLHPEEVGMAPLRLTIMVDGKPRPFEFFDDDREARVPLASGNNYTILVENPTQENRILRLLVDGQNTLAEATKNENGDYSWVAGCFVLPEKARYWVIPPGKYEIKGFYKEPRDAGQTEYNKFEVVDGLDSPAAKAGFREKVGIITAAVYTAVAFNRPVEMSGENRPFLGTRPGALAKEAVRLDTAFGPQRLETIIHIRY